MFSEFTKLIFLFVYWVPVAPQDIEHIESNRMYFNMTQNLHSQKHCLADPEAMDVQLYVPCCKPQALPAMKLRTA